MTDTLVYLDSAEDHPYARANDELALHAVRIEGTWNGWQIPVVTAAELRRFICVNANNDPRGSWNPEGIAEVNDVLSYRSTDDPDDDSDTWQAIDYDDDDNALYALDGWVWTL